MKNRLIIIAIGVICCFQTAATQLPQPFSIIPEPKSVTLHAAKGFDVEKLKTIHLKKGITLSIPGEYLSVLPVSAVKDDLVLLVYGLSARFTSKEAYELRIEQNSIVITAADEACIFTAANL